MNLFFIVAFVSPAQADIFQWEYIDPADPGQGKRQSAMLAPDGAGVDAVPRADLSGRNLTMAFLIGTDLSAGSTTFFPIGANLPNANLSRADLTDSNLAGTNLTDADFSGADVLGASFNKTSYYCGAVCISPFRPGHRFDFGTGIKLAQLYSTASYQARDLRSIGFARNDLTGAYFAGQSLSRANFYGATLSNANLSEANLTDANFAAAQLDGVDFTAADARGAQYLQFHAGAVTNNLILSDGHINGLDLDAGRALVVRDHDGVPTNTDNLGTPAPIPPIRITVDECLAMGPGGTLRMVFEADAWDSTISFAPGIPVTLGGTLELTFANGVNLASQVGRTLDLFDWTGVNRTGAFAISSPYAWDLSKLYTTGEVALTAVPEPANFALAIAVLGVVGPRRRRSSFERILTLDIPSPTKSGEQ